jgi:hypothetical protein
MFLQSSFPNAAAMQNSELMPGVVRQVQNAEQYGLVTEQQIAKYVIAAWCFGEDFDKRFHGANRILLDEFLPETKADLLSHWCMAMFAQAEVGS